MRSGGTGFNPVPLHTKVVNNGNSCSRFGNQILGRARTGCHSDSILSIM